MLGMEMDAIIQPLLPFQILARDQTIPDPGKNPLQEEDLSPAHRDRGKDRWGGR